ncbi:MAG TPA: hypothetical protein VF502_02130 [Stellaceae bacterium]
MNTTLPGSKPIHSAKFHRKQQRVHVTRSGRSVWTRAKDAIKSALPDPVVFTVRKAKVAAQRMKLIQVPAVPQFLDIVHDASFQRSVREIKHITQFDTPRLANLWQLCRMSEPGGNILEVGVHRGGSAIHLMNCQPDAKFFLADTFSRVDGEEVMSRLASKRSNVTVLTGVFPESDKLAVVQDISFAHIDVVVYDSCQRSLEYVAQRCRASATIVVNDCLRYPWGVTEAVCDFLDTHPEWIALPIYPGQAVLVSRDGHYPFARLGRSPDVLARIDRLRMPTFGTKADPLPVS